MGSLQDGRTAFGNAVVSSLKLERVFSGFGEDFRINLWHQIAKSNPAEEILISFWLFPFKVGVIISK